MKAELFGIENLEMYLVLGILVVFGTIEVIAGHLSKQQRSWGDWIQEAGGALVLTTIIKPAIVFTVYFVFSKYFSSASTLLTGLTLWLALPTYLLIDDVMQYWYHRSAHEYPFLWKLHRTHHQAEQMGFFVSYRNAALYYFMMPNIWWMSLFTALGGGLAVAIGLVLKHMVIISAHSTVKWDKPLYEFPVFRNIMGIVERIIVTPAFHHAHHGKSKIDGVSDPNGNFGNMFSIWDQLFGSALYTRQFPTDYGLQNDPKEPWTAAYLYPLVKAKDANSELAKGYEKLNTTTLEPTTVRLEKGEKILWCTCGKSKNQPYCDSSHHGSKFKPLLFEAQRTGPVRFCNCKLTEVGPFCDGSHNMG